MTKQFSFLTDRPQTAYTAWVQHLHGVFKCWDVPDESCVGIFVGEQASITSISRLRLWCSQKEITTPAPMQARYKAVMQERQEADGVEAMDI